MSAKLARYTNIAPSEFDALALSRALALEREADQLVAAEFDVAAAIATLGKVTSLKGLG